MGLLQAYAEEVRKAGRYGDTMLAHITPREAGILKLLGGSGNINPNTGIMEFNRILTQAEAANYLQDNLDVANAIPNNMTALQWAQYHWSNNGQYEGRTIRSGATTPPQPQPQPATLPQFLTQTQARNYILNNDDVLAEHQRTVNETRMTALQYAQFHYEKYGKSEIQRGLRPSLDKEYISPWAPYEKPRPVYNNTAAVTAAYQKTLGRKPTAEEINFWKHTPNLSEQAAIESIYARPEYKRTLAVKDAYIEVLGQEPDENTIKIWLSLGHFTKTNVVDALKTTPEYQLRESVQNVFQALIQAPPDSEQELQNFINKIKQQGSLTQDIIREIGQKNPYKYVEYQIKTSLDLENSTGGVWESDAAWYTAWLADYFVKKGITDLNDIDIKYRLEKFYVSDGDDYTAQVPVYINKRTGAEIKEFRLPTTSVGKDKTGAYFHIENGKPLIRTHREADSNFGPVLAIASAIFLPQLLPQIIGTTAGAATVAQTAATVGATTAAEVAAIAAGASTGLTNLIATNFGISATAANVAAKMVVNGIVGAVQAEVAGGDPVKGFLGSGIAPVIGDIVGGAITQSLGTSLSAPVVAATQNAVRQLISTGQLNVEQMLRAGASTVLQNTLKTQLGITDAQAGLLTNTIITEGKNLESLTDPIKMMQFVANNQNLFRELGAQAEANAARTSSGEAAIPVRVTEAADLGAFNAEDPVVAANRAAKAQGWESNAQKTEAIASQGGNVTPDQWRKVVKTQDAHQALTGTRPTPQQLEAYANAANGDPLAGIEKAPPGIQQALRAGQAEFIGATINAYNRGEIEPAELFQTFKNEGFDDKNIIRILELNHENKITNRQLRDDVDRIVEQYTTAYTSSSGANRQETINQLKSLGIEENLVNKILFTAEQAAAAVQSNQTIRNILNTYDSNVTSPSALKLLLEGAGASREFAEAAAQQAARMQAEAAAFQAVRGSLQQGANRFIFETIKSVLAGTTPVQEAISQINAAYDPDGRLGQQIIDKAQEIQREQDAQFADALKVADRDNEIRNTQITKIFTNLGEGKLTGPQAIEELTQLEITDPQKLVSQYFITLEGRGAQQEQVNAVAQDYLRSASTSPQTQQKRTEAIESLRLAGVSNPESIVANLDTQITKAKNYADAQIKFINGEITSGQLLEAGKGFMANPSADLMRLQAIRAGRDLTPAEMTLDTVSKLPSWTVIDRKGTQVSFALNDEGTPYVSSARILQKGKYVDQTNKFSGATPQAINQYARESEQRYVRDTQASIQRAGTRVSDEFFAQGSTMRPDQAIAQLRAAGMPQALAKDVVQGWSEQKNAIAQQNLNFDSKNLTTARLLTKQEHEQLLGRLNDPKVYRFEDNAILDYDAASVQMMGADRSSFAVIPTKQNITQKQIIDSYTTYVVLHEALLAADALPKDSNGRTRFYIPGEATDQIVRGAAKPVPTDPTIDKWGLTFTKKITPEVAQTLPLETWVTSWVAEAAKVAAEGVAFVAGTAAGDADNYLANSARSLAKIFGETSERLRPEEAAASKEWLNKINESGKRFTDGSNPSKGITGPLWDMMQSSGAKIVTYFDWFKESPTSYLWNLGKEMTSDVVPGVLLAGGSLVAAKGEDILIQ